MLNKALLLALGSPQGFPTCSQAAGAQLTVLNRGGLPGPGHGWHQQHQQHQEQQRQRCAGGNGIRRQAGIAWG